MNGPTIALHGSQRAHFTATMRRQSTLQLIRACFTCSSGLSAKDANPLGIYVYMLRCSDGSYCVGSATGDDLAPRIDQHNAGGFPGYTLSRRPVILVWSEYFDRITDGIAIERQIKGWSRAKKEALVRGDWKDIRQLSRRRAGAPKPS